jgi:anti-sigma B factor antagonist
MDEPRIRTERALTIQIVGDGSAQRIELVGELDLASSDAFEEEIRSAERARPAKLVIDLSRLRFIDSRGIECLVRAVQRSRDDGTQLELIHGPEPVEHVFQIAGLVDLLPFREAPAELRD